MSIQGDFGTEIKPDCFKQVTVKTVKYEEEDIEKIHLETTEGETFEWGISTYNTSCMEEFLRARADILNEKITEGTEVTLKCNANKILAFVL